MKTTTTTQNKKQGTTPRTLSAVASNLKNTMKTNNATKKATANNAKNNPAKVTAPAAPKTSAVKITLPGGLIWKACLAILTGARGILCRQVETATDKKTGRTFVRALVDENGLKLGAKAEVCEIINDVLTGEKIGRIQMGGYVNGRNTGAKIQLSTLAQFEKISAPCLVRWNNADDGEKIHGRYVGNPVEKGLLAVVVKYGNGFVMAWQVEQDSNAHNRHERGQVLPVKEGAKLAAVKW